MSDFRSVGLHGPLALAIVLSASCSLQSTSVLAQQAPRGETPSALPRPGFEPRNLRLGGTIIAPELTVGQTYDSNIFANSSDEADFITMVAPTIRSTTSSGKLTVDTTTFATYNQFAEHLDQSRPTYGTGFQGVYAASAASSLQAGASYARLVENPADTEQQEEQRSQLFAYDAASAQLSYTYRRNRIGISGRGSLDRTDFVNADENDRDRWGYVGALRGSFLLTPRFSTFLEGYADRIDYDGSQQDFSDYNTYGFYVGTTIDVAAKWFGEVAFGLFYTENDDRNTSNSIQVGARTALTWSISPRTALTGFLFRQQVPTVQAGAARIETDAGLSLSQEARHNILIGASVGTSYRQYEGARGDQIAPFVSISGDYLLNRTTSLYSLASFTKNWADQRNDAYDRAVITIGSRFRF